MKKLLRAGFTALKTFSICFILFVFASAAKWVFSLHRSHLGLAYSSFEEDRRDPRLNVTAKTKKILLYTKYYR